MSLAYFVNVSFHVLAALFWLGGMFFLAVVGAPVLRRVEPAALRQQLFHGLGARFRTAGWVAIGVLVVTGAVNLHFRGLLRWSGALAEPALWQSAYGRALAIKLCAVATMLVVAALHDFVLGPVAGRAEPGSPRATALRRRAALLARANALVGLVVVLAAVWLARGG